ncbi:hypothetical protein [Herbaspirillum sp. YR522]|uniref:hypothetical protein n=1 Tax=Herbaspirillum sp. YR522 TaxID=1144342 RepID=UPI00026F536A|nr:hypothetical protein [Herbaspirillum sp. YR522]EJN08425.1 hypothetical protein PMI40_01286 [Herbaspirillum sp. YR522]
MQVLSPSERKQIGGATCLCPFPALAKSEIDMPMPSSRPRDDPRVFADSVTARELWPL